MNNYKIKVHQLFSILAVIAIISGIFLPAYSIPFMGDQNFYQNQYYVSLFILGNAILYLVFSFTSIKGILWIMASLMLGGLSYAYYDFQNTMSQFDQIMGEGPASIFIQKMRDSFKESVEFKMGLFILIFGILLSYVAAALKK